MSKTVEWGISDKQHEGIIKIVGLLLNMIQESDREGKVYLGEGNRMITAYPMEIYDKILVIQSKGVYNEEEQKYLNLIRNLVLEYKKEKEKEKFLDEFPFFVNSEGQIVSTLSNETR